MKATELINKLQEIIKTHGDVEVASWPYDGGVRVSPLTSVKFISNEVPLKIDTEDDQSPDTIKNFIQLDAD